MVPRPSCAQCKYTRREKKKWPCPQIIGILEEGLHSSLQTNTGLSAVLTARHPTEPGAPSTRWPLSASGGITLTKVPPEERSASHPKKKRRENMPQTKAVP